MSGVHQIHTFHDKHQCDHDKPTSITHLPKMPIKRAVQDPLQARNFNHQNKPTDAQVI